LNKLISKSYKEVPDELNEYEEILTKYMWVIMFLLIIADACTRYVLDQIELYRDVFYIQGISFLVSVFICIFKTFQSKKQQIKPGLKYSALKLLDIIIIIVFLNTLYNRFMFSFLMILPLISVCITRGLKISVYYLVFALTVHIGVWHAFSLCIGSLLSNYAYVHQWFFYSNNAILFLALFIFLKMFGTYNTRFNQNEDDNNNLVSQLGRKYAQLDEAKQEKQEQLDKLVKINKQLKEANKRLNASNAEFFTLQQISQAISSLFDMNELLNFVNDIVLGVMGASTSSIILYSGNRLKVQMSNIQNIKDRAILSDNINNSALKEAIERGEIIVDNNVTPDVYEFTRDRNVRSLICVPLQVKTQIHGLLLIEHSISGAFGDDNIQLLAIITQQVSIAIENARLYEQLQESANTDGLTQLYNRLFFQKSLCERLENARRDSYDVSVILYDIDDFKMFNDTYGHLFGDIVLKSVAQLVKESVRKDDIVARFGGEEFIILLPHTSAEVAFEKANEIRKKVASHVVCEKDISVSVTISVGVSSFPELAQTGAQLLKSADIALYEAKANGKNCVSIAH
jgi:diguanylate cyclase (GGDEF)-like protein